MDCWLSAVYRTIWIPRNETTFDPNNIPRNNPPNRITLVINNRNQQIHSRRYHQQPRNNPNHPIIPLRKRNRTQQQNNRIIRHRENIEAAIDEHQNEQNTPPIEPHIPRKRKPPREQLGRPMRPQENGYIGRECRG
jgi:hypothetical protein